MSLGQQEGPGYGVAFDLAYKRCTASNPDPACRDEERSLHLARICGTRSAHGHVLRYPPFERNGYTATGWPRWAYNLLSWDIATPNCACCHVPLGCKAVLCGACVHKTAKRRNSVESIAYAYRRAMARVAKPTPKGKVG